jgi:WD40 repeat protein
LRSACGLLATGSDDKTERLWSLPNGRLLRTVRWPIGRGGRGKVYATALSPDGTLVAVGGSDAHPKDDSVYLFDAHTGALKGRVGEFEGMIVRLTFSADGRFLAGGGSHGLRVIDVERMSVAGSDRDYGDSSYRAAFASDGRLFTVSWDGYLRSYDRSFRLIKKVRTSGRNRPLITDPSFIDLDDLAHNLLVTHRSLLHHNEIAGHPESVKDSLRYRAMKASGANTRMWRTPRSSRWANLGEGRRAAEPKVLNPVTGLGDGAE